jgi:hypothetical protein
VIDGEDRASLEAWVRKYMAIPEREPAENDVLADRLTSVPGFVYTNWWESPTRQMIDELFPGATVTSAHAVGDEDGTIGGLVLAECDGTTIDELADRLDASARVATTARTIGPVEVRYGKAGTTNFYGWVEDGVCGVFAGTITASDEAFMKGLLAG